MSEALKKACMDLFGVSADPQLTRPDESLGDYSTNLSLRLASELSKSPREIAASLVLEAAKIKGVASADVAGPGFINLRLSDEALAKSVSSANKLPQTLKGQTVVLEHTDPNPFKEFHIGHAYSNTVGVAVGKLLEAAGAKVHQVSYHGDVGLHIAMAVWAISRDKLASDSLEKALASGLGDYYAKGAQAYQDDTTAKTEIEAINKSLYAKDDPQLNKIYEIGRASSLKHFENIYKRLGTKFEKNYFESQCAGEGEEIVRKNLGKVFEKSEGAIVFDGEKAGLHKRVFITSAGLPTYEAKEIGLAFAKQRDYPSANQFVVITGNEIDDYFRVLVAAIKEIEPELAAKIKHLSHGMVKLPTGKMSSRSGTVKLFLDLEADIKKAAQKLYGKDKAVDPTVLGAIKYEFLRHRIGGDFVFDMEESISLHGNSGPYLRYAYARAKSILAKCKSTKVPNDQFEPDERALARKISEFPEVAGRASTELMPHYICTYLYELAQTFNSFYEKNRVVGDEREPLRAGLLKSYAAVLKSGLSILNIEAPERV